MDTINRLLAAVQHEDHEYRFYEYPNGEPSRCDGKPGQIKVYRQGSSRRSGERRVVFDQLPTPALKSTFVDLTRRTAEEIGVTIPEET